MNDRAVSVFENYDVKILGTAKGRGALLAETEQGWLILKEYTGPEARLELQEKLLQAVRDAGFPGVEQLLRNKEGELLTRDQDRTAYIVKTWFDGRECNLRDVKECQNAARTLGRLHLAMEQPQLAAQYTGRPFSLEREYARHNRELKKVRRYLREKGQKSDFERFLLHHYDRFYEKALETEEQLKRRPRTGRRPSVRLWPAGLKRTERPQRRVYLKRTDGLRTPAAASATEIFSIITCSAAGTALPSSILKNIWWIIR